MHPSSNTENRPQSNSQSELEPNSPQSSSSESSLKSAKRRALGRGLGALLSNTENPVPITQTTLVAKIQREVQPAASGPISIAARIESARDLESSTASAQGSELIPSTSPHTSVSFLAISSVSPNAKQPRKAFPEKELQQLSDSIAQSGLLQPIVVRPKPPTDDGVINYEIVAGERRYRAAKLAGLTAIPVIIKDIGDRECLALSIVENVQRQDLNPIEEALAYQRLISEFGLTPTEIAKEVGRDRSSIANALRLLKLPEAVQRDIIIGKLSAGHGRAILMVESLELQLELAEKISAAALSVRQAEELARGYLNHNISPDANAQTSAHAPRNKTPLILEIEERLRRVLGTKLSLNLSPEGKGELRIAIYSQDDLQNLIDKLGA